MAVRSPDTARPRHPTYLCTLGLLAMTSGLALLLLPVLDRAPRPVGATAVLLGVVLVGRYFILRLKAEMLTDGTGGEPAWRKPAHGSAGLAKPTTAAPPDKFPESAFRPSVVSPTDVPAAVPVSIPPAAPPKPVWGPELFAAMSPQQFEAVCEALLAQGGFQTRCQSHGTAGGVTIWLHSRHAPQGTDNPAAVALCKQWPGQPVGVKEMHPLLELMAARRLNRGTYATSSSYTDNARKFARYNSINALDGAALLNLIARRTPGQQQALLALAHRGD
jgi:restriction system protein